MARSFNGSTDEIIAPAQQWPQAAFTCLALLNTTNSLATQVPLSIYDDGAGGTAKYFQTIILVDGTLIGRMHDQASSTFIGRTTNAGAISLSTDYRIAWTWSGGTTDAAIKIYINGTQADTTNGGSGVFVSVYTGSDIKFYLGGQHVNNSINTPFTGKFAEVAIYNVALDANEAAAYGRGYSPELIRTSNLIRYWPLLRSNIDVKAAAPTITGTTVVPHPRIIMSRKNKSPSLRAPSSIQLRAQIWM